MDRRALRGHKGVGHDLATKQQAYTIITVLVSFFITKVLVRFTEGDCFLIVWMWLLATYLLQNPGLLTSEDALGPIHSDACVHSPRPESALSSPLGCSHFISHAGLT